MTEQNTERQPFMFFVLTFAYSWLLWLPSMLSGWGTEIPVDVSAYTAVVVPIGAFAPMFAAITLIFRKKGWPGVKAFLRQAVDFRAKPLFYILALLIPVIIHTIAHYLAPAIGLEVVT